MAIVGAGMRCAVGLSAPAAAAAVRAGVSGIREHPYMLDKAGEPMVVAAEPTLDPVLQDAKRFAALAAPAVAEALEPLAAHGAGAQIVHALIGLPQPRPGLPADIDRALDRMVQSVSPSTPRVQSVAFLARGSAAGLIALQAARDILWRGTCRFCLVGGVDSYLSAETLEWMDEHGMLKSSANRNGFPPGEAAGFLLLASGTTASAFGMPVRAWLETLGFALEASPIRTQTICVGRGLSQAFQQAIAPLQMPRDRIDDAICDMNGEPYRSEEFAFTVLRTQTAFVDATRFTTPADCWGDVGAASGPLFAGLAAAAFRRGYAKGPRTMAWASSEGGERAAAVFRAPWTVAGGGA